MRGFLLASCKAGRKACSQSNPTRINRSAWFNKRHEARFHRHPVRVFNTRGQAVNLDLVSADVARQVRQISKSRNDVDFVGVAGSVPAQRTPKNRMIPNNCDGLEFM